MRTDKVASTTMSARLGALLLLLAAIGEASIGVAGVAKPNDSAGLPCPSDCVCKNALSVDCRGSGISNVTDFLRGRPITKLDLGHADVRQLGADAFAHLPALEELNLGGNYLRNIHPEAFRHPTLKSLSLQSVHLTRIPAGLFAHLPNLQSMRLDSNQITHLEPAALLGLTSLRHLRLDVNRLGSVPHEALARSAALEYLNLSFNKIKSVPAAAFSNNSALVVLMLDHNDIEHIDDEAFQGLHSLKVLELRHNQIKQIRAPHLGHLPMLYELYLNNNNITHLRAGVFQQSARVSVLELKGNPLASIDHETFAFLPRLQKLILSEVKELRYFPSLNGTTSLELVRVDRARIVSLPDDLCKFCPYLRSLDVKSNFIAAIPDLSRCSNLRLLDMSHNEIGRLDEYAFRHQSHLHDLLLSHNRIDAIGEHALAGLRKLKTLDLSGNFIESIHAGAFLPLVEIQDVNLGHNRFPAFPSLGLENVLHVKVHNNPNLREFPAPASFPRVKTLALSYAYHCCPFQRPAGASSSSSPFAIGGGGSGEDGSLSDSIIFPSSEHGIDLTAWAKGEAVWVDSSQQWANASQQWVNMAALNLSEADIEKLLAKSSLSSNRALNFEKNHITCIPEPSPFMPCQDLFDWWSLRCGVWIVFLMALLGNGAVVFVLIFARSKIDVPRFLVCNLGMADFFMGIYLGFLAVVDASTLGEFRKYAIPWQLSAGCQVAGFFGVLSSELSVFTLAVITMERNYAITHAMHLNKRLSLRHASYIMAAGWLFALVMAVLPLVGVSDYRKFAVCLPFEVGNASSMGYVVFLMVINGVAFLILMGCYLKMYCAIRGSQAWNSNDSRIAKRMALLVFTDFLCWAPIAFFSLTAASGWQFISLEEAKIFTVFILPLNSCCNPFLYAILTKQFKKDCVMICKAIEESRVTRGIGRCRHSSNFSNRQTPGNTNSLGDRNSSKDGSSCQCQGRGLLKEDKHSSSSSSHHHHHHHYERRPARRLHWIRSPMRAFLRRIRAGDRELGGESTSSANEYAYRIAEIQQKQRVQRNKHRRAESVSSDNFSSSRSDSVKAIGCGLPLRMAGRRRNSWTVTRKPSSDSNLSSSRNDSSTSAMTASTSAGNSTWRNSRSSVSSDGGSIRDRDRIAGGHNKCARGGPAGAAPAPPPPTIVTVAHLPQTSSTDVHVRRAASVRGEKARVLPTSPLAAGIVRQQSVATPTGNLVQRTIIPLAHPPPLPVEPAPDHAPAAVTSGADFLKGKPRLTRQIAVSDEAAVNLLAGSSAKCVSFDPACSGHHHHHHHHHHQPPPRLHGVWESSVEDDEDDSQAAPCFEETADEHSSVRPKDRLSLPPTFGGSARNRLGLVGFVPRKLSTISSRSCSVNPDGDVAQQDPETVAPLLDGAAIDSGQSANTPSNDSSAAVAPSEPDAGLDVRFPPDETPPPGQSSEQV